MIKREMKSKYNFSFLHLDMTKRDFANSFWNHYQTHQTAEVQNGNLNHLNMIVYQSFRSACEEIVPQKEVSALRP